MKIKIWTGLITLVLAAVILRSYLIGQTGMAIGPALQEKEMWQTEVSEKDREEHAAGEIGTQGETGIQQETNEEVMEEMRIRVLIKNNGFQGVFHDKLEITGTGHFQVQNDKNFSVYDAGSVLTLEAECGSQNGMEEQNADKMVITPVEPEGQLQILNLKRSQNPPSYQGSLEILRQEEGYVVINELPLEDYLPSVLSSEMSSSFPSEALKAQAISARTYALKRMAEKNESCFGANLDDSVSFQVYNNVGKDENTVRAVRDTAGQVLLRGEELADVFYYSTSCGVTAQDSFCDETELAYFLENGRRTDLEQEEPWYRWQTAVSEGKVRQNLTEMELDTPEQITGISVLQRQENGRAQLIGIHGENSILQISGEYEIRRALAPDNEICLKDGSVCSPMELLPSAWFVLEENGPENGAGETDDSQSNVWQLLGGGFGHGNGLSQNGAKCMAEAGADCEEILEFYYPGIQIGSWHQRGEG